MTSATPPTPEQLRCAHDWHRTTEYAPRQRNQPATRIYFRDLSFCAKCGLVSRGPLYRALAPKRKGTR